MAPLHSAFLWRIGGRMDIIHMSVATYRRKGMSRLTMHFIQFSINNILMKHIITLLMVTLTMVACGPDAGHVSIGAHFLSMNQATFYVYSPDGLLAGVDTLAVNGGRFEYEPEVQREGTLVIVFPNYAQVPLFVEPGASISIEGDAAKLRTMEITGTKTNKLFTEWRKQTLDATPQQMQRHAEQFIRDNPTSVASIWLLRQYFVLAEKPDMQRARKLATLMRDAMKAEDNDEHLRLLARSTGPLQRGGGVAVGDAMPRFTARDVNGKAITLGELLHGTTVVMAWATWNENSKTTLRQLASNQQYAKAEEKIDHVVTVCLDPSKAMCQKTMEKSSAENLVTVCDTMMWASNVVRDLCITSLPWNMKVRDGKIIGMNLPNRELLNMKK